LTYLASEQCEANVRHYLEATLAENTLRAYRADLKQFTAWGGKIPATPESVAAYIAHHATRLACSTLSRHLVAIAHAHIEQGLTSPTHAPLVRATLQGIRRSRGSALRQAAPLLKPQMLHIVRSLNGLSGLRDAALLLIGFASAMRRSELVSLNVEDVRLTDEGLVLRLRRSKTDQEGQGRDIAIPKVRGKHCPTKALQAWLRASGITSGAVFRRISRYGHVLPYRLSSQSVALIVKKRAVLAGLDPERLSGHSLRAGFVTSAAKTGASFASIRMQTGHKSDAILQRYIRESHLFSDNPNLKIWQG